jgi:TolB-like protein
MKSPIKLTWVTLATALFMAAGINCGGPKQVSQTTTARPAPAPSAAAAPAPAPAYSNTPQTPAPVITAPASSAAPTAKTSTVDELDVAIRDASDCLNDNIPKGSKIVILNIESSSANLAEYIIDELIANAINDKNCSVVDRRQLEAIQSEQKFQMSGAVADKDALRIGQFFGAQTIVSGAMREMGGRYRMTIRALAVETAVVQSQCNQNVAVAASATLIDIVNSGGSRPASGAAAYGATTSGITTQTASTPATATAQPAAPAEPIAQVAPVEPTIQGTMVPGKNLTQKLEWLTRSADSRNTYIIEVNADDTIAPYMFAYKGGVDITIVLRGDNVNRTIWLRSNGVMFTVRKDVTFILDNNVTLHGRSKNTGSMVYVESEGTFKMRTGSAIIGNNIKNSDVNSRHSGGVLVGGTFEMSGGAISGNTGWKRGGGVTLVSRDYAHFIMIDGIISNNNALDGGGVYVSEGKFTMRGGTITGNTADVKGGGVFLCSFGCVPRFTKTGGIITGYNSDQANGNAVKDEDGNILARKGHAVFFNENRRKETTSGPNADMSLIVNGSGRLGEMTGAWDGEGSNTGAASATNPKAGRR